MPTLDLAMPTALFLTVLVALILSKRIGNKVTENIEHKEFKIRDVILLVAFILVAVLVIGYTAMMNPSGIFGNGLQIFFLCSYTTLLFTFTYMFSNATKQRIQLISTGFGAAASIAGIASLTGPLSDAYTIYRVIAFFALATFCFGTTIYEQQKSPGLQKNRWYLSVQLPALFVLLFIFFNVLYGGVTQIWYPYLLDIFGFTFAILIIVYLSSLFTWKTVGLFAVLLTIIDIYLVFTGPMVSAANIFTDLGLPVVIYLPNIPPVISEAGILLFRGLGLGDYFFAGILSVQTYNKYGKKTAITALIAIAIAFGIWMAFMPEMKTAFGIAGFPATVCIISGWIPIIAYKLLRTKNKPTPLLSPVESVPTITDS
ncbi:MAG: hypothetical protein LBQ98_02625 [Nitrososphaerota archaeon]|nr:hypothetical protein [Nitrososphaerota archaeon]